MVDPHIHIQSFAGIAPTIHSTIINDRDVAKPSNLRGIFADKAVAAPLFVPERVLVRQLDGDVKVLKPIPIVIRKTSDGYIASFGAANAHASGDSWIESVINLQYWLVDLFNNLLSHQNEKLGPAPKRQLEVLHSYLSRTKC